MKKISFDFDSTLSRSDIKLYAQELIDDGNDVWICTSRLHPDNAPNSTWNDDLFEVSDALSIPRDKIIFTNYTDKATVLDNSFDLHLDDDSYEITQLNTHTNISTVNVFGNKFWMFECNKILKR